MPHVTAILGQEVGIQYQGVKDASSLIGAYPISGVIVGSFRRGRLDQPMTITRENIKAKLGYDPSNPDYLVVQDALDSGVPSVQVLRVVSAELNHIPTCIQVDHRVGRDHYTLHPLLEFQNDEVHHAAILKFARSLRLMINGQYIDVNLDLDNEFTVYPTATLSSDGKVYLNIGEIIGSDVEVFSVCANTMFDISVSIM